MRSNMSHRRSIVVILIALLAPVSLASGQAAVAKNGAHVMPPDSHPAGNSYAEWSAVWWRWVADIPVSRSPINDPGGPESQICTDGEGQSGNVWFLAGSAGNPVGTVITRYCTIPSGKFVFFPIINSQCGNFVERTDDTEAMKRARCAVNINQVRLLQADIDGEAVRGDLADFRFQSPYVTDWFAGPENRYGYPVGANYQFVSDGYWLMIPPLSVGEHTIQYRGLRVRADNTTFNTEVRYHLTVASGQPSPLATIIAWLATCYLAGEWLRSSKKALEELSSRAFFIPPALSKVLPGLVLQRHTLVSKGP